MLNKERYAKEIFDIACSGHSIAVENGKVFPCNETSCRNCIGCSDISVWCNSEYVEPFVDWSKVEVDTPILVRNEKMASNDWQRRHFAKYANGRVYAYTNGETSWSVCGDTNVSSWDYAKLAE